MGAEFGLDSDEDLQIDERLGKEKASLIIRSSMFLFYFSLSCHFPFGLGLNLLVFWFTRLYILSYFFWLWRFIFQLIPYLLELFVGGHYFRENYIHLFSFFIYF